MTSETHGRDVAGNFHYCLAIDVTNQREILEAKAFAERLAERAIRMGGTCSGEHGLGYGKLKFMEVSRTTAKRTHAHAHARAHTKARTHGARTHEHTDTHAHPRPYAPTHARARARAHTHTCAHTHAWRVRRAASDSSFEWL